MSKRAEYALAGCVALFCLADADALIVLYQAIYAFIPSLLLILLLIATISTTQLWGQYWLLGWGKRQASQENMVQRMKAAFFRWAERIGVDVYVQQLFELLDILYQPIRAAVQTFLGWIIRRGGYTSLVILGLVPLWGFRTPGMVICRANNWRRGMWVLVGANAVRIGYLLWILHRTLHAFAVTT